MPDDFYPSYINKTILDRFPSHWQLMMNGDKLLIGEGCEYSFIRPWKEKRCHKCLESVNVQEFILPDTPFDNAVIESFNEKKKEVYSEFYKEGVFNIDTDDLRKVDFQKIACYEKYSFGSIWYFSKQEFGTIIKNCDC